MATARDIAKDELGSLDLSYLDKERSAAKDVYNTSGSSLKNNFDTLLGELSKSRTDARRNFNTGRSAVAENEYNNNRMGTADLASRIVGKTGLQKLNEVGNRMETGQAYSKLGNTFYDTMGELDSEEKQGRTQYDLDAKSLKDNLEQVLAGIDTRGAEANNSYNNTLAQLAETVQGRLDSNANAKASIASNEKIAAQNLELARKAQAENNKALKKQMLMDIVKTKDINGNPVSKDTMISNIMNEFNVDSNTAIEVLKQIGVIHYTSTAPRSYYDILGPSKPSAYNLLALAILSPQS